MLGFLSAIKSSFCGIRPDHTGPCNLPIDIAAYGRPHQRRA